MSVRDYGWTSRIFRRFRPGFDGSDPAVKIHRQKIPTANVRESPLQPRHRVPTLPAMSAGVIVHVPRSILEEVAFRLMHRHRVAEFLVRHGGEGARPQQREELAGGGGWSEVYAADGYSLRCEWSRTGAREDVQFLEIAPRTPAGGASSSAPLLNPHGR